MVKNVIIIVLAILVLFFFILVLTDICLYLKDILSKYHIGRWNSDSQWEERIYNVSVKWVYKTPTVKITDNERYVLLDMLNGRYRSQSIQSWQTAALLLGLLEKGDKQNASKAAMSYIDTSGGWKQKPTAVDSGLLSYSVMKSVPDRQFIKPAMDDMLALILKQKDKDGLICYNGDSSNPEKYVDTLGLVCPFLVYYANIYHKPEYEKLAFKQLEFYHNYGLLANTCLPNHAVNSDTKLPLGVFGWGRGTAWYIIGLIGTYQEISDEKIKSILKNWILDCAESYKNFQNKNGGFGSILQRMNTYDSSVTAVMSYFYFVCSKMFNNKLYEAIAQKSLEKLKKVTRQSGAIDYCQGDTKGIGIFAQYYDIMPFAQGYALNAIELSKKVKNK